MKYLLHLVYITFFASLWYEFAKGSNVYLDRFITIMTPAYALSATIMTLVAICVGIALHALKEDKNLKTKLEKIPPAAFEALQNLNKSILYNMYVYLGFYPAIICAGILLGKPWLFSFMLVDAAMGRIIKAQMKGIHTELTREQV